MKKYLLSVALCVFSTTYVYAQNAGKSDNLPKQLRAPEGQGLFLNYNNRYVNSGIEGRMMLDEIYTRGLEKSADNIKAVRQLLAAKITFDEKVALTRILASMYSPESAAEFNNVILSDLRGLASSGHKELGRTAALAYSRLGYFADSLDMLASAKNANYIDNQEYFGELAHLLPYAPQDVQESIFGKIKSAGNMYSAEILASHAKNPEQLKRVSPKTLDVMQVFLEENEPKFPQATGEFGLFDAIRYASWLHAIATINSATKNANYSDFVIARLSSERVDPRKIMSFLISAEGSQLIFNVGQTKALENLQRKVSIYSTQYPMNSVMRDVTFEINARIKLAKR